MQDLGRGSTHNIQVIRVTVCVCVFFSPLHVFFFPASFFLSCVHSLILAGSSQSTKKSFSIASFSPSSGGGPTDATPRICGGCIGLWSVTTIDNRAQGKGASFCIIIMKPSSRITIFTFPVGVCFFIAIIKRYLVHVLTQRQSAHEAHFFLGRPGCKRFRSDALIMARVGLANPQAPVFLLDSKDPLVGEKNKRQCEMRLVEREREREGEWPRGYFSRVLTFFVFSYLFYFLSTPSHLGVRGCLSSFFFCQYQAQNLTVYLERVAASRVFPPMKNTEPILHGGGTDRLLPFGTPPSEMMASSFSHKKGITSSSGSGISSKGGLGGRWRVALELSEGVLAYRALNQSLYPGEYGRDTASSSSSSSGTTKASVNLLDKRGWSPVLHADIPKCHSRRTAKLSECMLLGIPGAVHLLSEESKFLNHNHT